MKDTVQELVDALDVMTTSILERITDTWILRLKIKPGSREIFLTDDYPAWINILLHGCWQRCSKVNHRTEVFLSDSESCVVGQELHCLVMVTPCMLFFV